MKNNSLSINPIGLAQDFLDLFEEISKLESSSDNWFQQYRVKSNRGSFILKHLDNTTSECFSLSEFEQGISSTKNKVIPLSNEQFIVKYQELLLQCIKKSSIYRGEDNDMSLLFSEMLEENKVSTLYILNDLFIKNIQNEILCVKILSLCNDFGYEELNPTAQTLAALSINHTSKRVRSAAMNLFSHWGTHDAYNLLLAINCPNEPWIKMKYNNIKKSLERRWCMQEK